MNQKHKKILQKIIAAFSLVLIPFFLYTTIADYKYKSELLREGIHTKAVLVSVERSENHISWYEKVFNITLDDGEELLISPFADRAKGRLQAMWWRKKIGQTFPVVLYDKHYLDDYDGKLIMHIKKPYMIWKNVIISLSLALILCVYPYKVLVHDRKKDKK